MKKLKLSLISILGFAVILSCLVICIFVAIMNFWSRTMSSNPNFAAFGDGGSIMIPIDPDKALSVGDYVEEGNFEITLQDAGHYRVRDSLEKLDADLIYWYVTVVFENKSAQTLWLDPLSMSRIQGMLTRNQGSNYPYKDFGEASNRNGQENLEIEPQEKFTTTLIYKVPLENDLFWIFGEHDKTEAVFQVR